MVALAREQRELGFNTKIWALDRGHPSEDGANTNSYSNLVRFFQFLGPPSIGFSPAMEHAAGMPAAQKYDIWHQHSIWMANSRATEKWRKKWHKPSIIAPHGTLETSALKISGYKKRLALMAYEARNLCEASCFHACSYKEANSIRAFGLSQPIAIIPNGVQQDWLKSSVEGTRFRNMFKINPERRILLFLSRLHPIKGLPLLFEAMAELHDELGSWLLVIAGPDQSGYRNKLDQLSRKYGIEKWIQFVGPLLGEMKRASFEAAEVFVLPTLSENFGIVVAEALGAGLPVITTKAAPWGELITENCGWWTDVHSEGLNRALRQAIRLSSRELRIMGDNGRQLVNKEYTWRKAAEKTICLYQWLLGQGAKPQFVVME